MNLIHSLVDDAALSWPDKVAVSDKNVTITFSKLKKYSYLYAQYFKEQGIIHGDKVLLEAQNRVEIVPIIFGLLSLGASITPLHPSATEYQWQYIQETLNSNTFIKSYEENYVLTKNHINKTLPTILEISNLEVALHTQLDSQSAVISEDIALIIFSSGSTGKPKGITCLHHQVCFAANAIYESLDYRLDDKIFTALPLSFDYGFYQLILSLLSGASIYLVDPKSAGPTLIKELIQSHSTVMPAVPQMINNLAVFAARKASELAGLRLITNTGAAVAKDKVDRIRRSLPNVVFQLMYGLTECKRVSINPPNEDIKRPNSSGKALPGTKVSILDDNGSILPPHTSGQITVRGAHLMAGYWNADELNRERYKIENATTRTLYTGDYGYMDEDGYLYIEGRKDDIFKHRGFRVSCTEIEIAACELDVIDNAVLIQPQNGISKMTLFYTGNISPKELTKQLSFKLEEYKIPEKCTRLDSIPLSQNRKYDRNELKKISF